MAGQVDFQRRDGDGTLFDRMKVRATTRVLSFTRWPHPENCPSVRIARFDDGFGLVAKTETGCANPAQLFEGSIGNVDVQDHVRRDRRRREFLHQVRDDARRTIEVARTLACQ